MFGADNCSVCDKGLRALGGSRGGGGGVESKLCLLLMEENWYIVVFLYKDNTYSKLKGM